MEQVFPVLSSLVKMQVGRGNISSSDRNIDYSAMNEIWFTQEEPSDRHADGRLSR